MGLVRQLIIAVTAAFVGVQVAAAHPDEPIAPHDLWDAWNNNTFLLLTLELSVFAYLWRIWRLCVP
jgi:hypothetical protein